MFPYKSPKLDNPGVGSLFIRDCSLHLPTTSRTRRVRAPLEALKTRMKSFLATSFLTLTFAAQLQAQAGFGKAQKLNEDWSFSLGQQQVTDVSELDSCNGEWQTLDLPHDWSVRAMLSPELSSCTGYLPGGIGWYKKDFVIPSDTALGNNIFLYFEGVYNRSEVYLNGHLLGKRPNGYLSFLYDATPYVQFDQPNTIAVRVDHSRASDSRWYTGSGIYRDVWLVRAQPVHIAQWGVFASAKAVTETSADLQVDTEILNQSDSDTELTVIQSLWSDLGEKVSQSTTHIQVPAQASSHAAALLSVPTPRLWGLEEPHLYTLKTEVLQDGKVVDISSLRTGIRRMEFDPNTGFSLNGERMKMKGVCLHHDAGVLGSAVPREVWEQRLRTLKELGCNAIRTSHNPQATDLYDLCDELGLLVLDEAFDEWEFPKRKWLKGWNVGEPGFEGSFDFFETWGKRDLADMVRRDRNHPSIFAWSIGNEVDYPNDPYSHPVLNGSSISQPMYGGYKPDSPDAMRLGWIAKDLVSVVKAHDTSRPVTAALAGVVMSNETEYPFALDIVGYNYTENRYEIDHTTYPDRVIFGSENRHDYDAWQAVLQHDFILGQFLWTGIDYLGESGRWPSRGFYSGLIDFGGHINPRGRYRQALWSAQPVIYVGTMKKPKGDWQSMDAWPVWNYPDGETVRVLCYTNAVKVELRLNDKQVGEVKDFDSKSGIISWDIPFASGVLEVVGFDADGNESCRDHITTHGPAEQMQVTCDSTVVDRDHGWVMLELQVLDADGNRVMDSSQEVICHLEGPARLLGLEASNNEDMSDYSDAQHEVFQGRIKAYIQATGETGEVTVCFSSKGLPDALVHFTVK